MTKLSLHLKVLEGETAETLNGQLRLIAEPALPNLGKNIRCGNSLIGPDFYRQYDIGLFSDDEIRRINVFDWYDDEKGFGEIMRDGGFDAVIGNPPYVNVENIEEFIRKYLMKYYETTIKRFDIYIAFIERSLGFLNKGGYFSFILPYSFLFQNYAEKLRRLIIDKYNLISVLDLYDFKVFQDATVKNCVVVISNKKSTNDVHIIKPTNETELFNNDYSYIKKSNIQLFKKAPNNMYRIDATESECLLVDKMDGLSFKLGEIMYVNWGLRTGNIKKYILREKIDERCKKMIDAREVERYFIKYAGKYVWYKNKELYNPMFPELFENPKIFIRDISGRTRIRASFDDYNYYAEHTVSIAIPKFYLKDVKRRGLSISKENINLSKKYNQLYILGLINSKLMTKYFHILLSGGLHIYPNDIKSLPIRTIDFNNPSDVKMHDEMVRLVERMMDLKRRYHETDDERLRTQLDHAINATDSAIDALVYRLYGLTDEEIRIVEGGVYDRNDF
ncbi:MAG TPA: hypothetical protein ENI51_11465 [Candidatus Atribacteria bacterium]|nr:hypothetical protein [Candidatus Atribacteria bacterium]